MSNEFLMLAQSFKEQDVGGWFVSDKLDGMRAFWDGGISRGLDATKVAYADIGKTNIQVSTGLWSRYRKPIAAPDWFLDSLPRIPLDGELWLGVGQFQQLISITRSKVPDERWRKVQFRVFDSPHPMQWYNGDWKASETLFQIAPKVQSFEDNIDMLQEIVPHMLIKQVRLPRTGYKELLESTLEQVVNMGGEGLMIRHYTTGWESKRSRYLLKYKPFTDSEAMIVGYLWGADKYEGMLGALQCIWQNPMGKTVSFELSGMTDEERKMVADSTMDKTPRTKVGKNAFAVHFQLNTAVTFRYRTLSDAGVPREARYYRKEH